MELNSKKRFGLMILGVGAIMSGISILTDKNAGFIIGSVILALTGLILWFIK
ncbi:hypothetical protein K9L16_00410 [Candidatus Pacearchaeota archaeon]|nr:hypothetical protein [Candidatus Pacearchaeota archaeon]